MNSISQTEYKLLTIRLLFLVIKLLFPHDLSREYTTHCVHSRGCRDNQDGCVFARFMDVNENLFTQAIVLVALASYLPDSGEDSRPDRKKPETAGDRPIPLRRTFATVTAEERVRTFPCRTSQGLSKSPSMNYNTIPAEQQEQKEKDIRVIFFFFFFFFFNPFKKKNVCYITAEKEQNGTKR